MIFWDGRRAGEGVAAPWARRGRQPTGRGQMSTKKEES